MTTYLARDADGERVTRDIASATWRYFDRLAKRGAYGRKYAGQPERLDWVALVGTLPWCRVREFVEHVVFHFSADRCAPQNAARA
jgi:hypothetical protein